MPQKLLIQTRDAYSLHAELYSNEFSDENKISETNRAKDKPLIIFCHGFTGSKYEWGRFPKACEALLEAGFDSLIFDFAGSGENVREPVYLNRQVENLEDVANWAVSVGYSKLGSIGLSFGGITSLIAEIPQRKAAVFWAPAFYMNKIITPFNWFVIKTVFTLFPRKRIYRKSSEPDYDDLILDARFFNDIENIEPELYLRNFKIPALVIQGSSDSTVKPELTMKAFSNFPVDDDHQLVMVENAGHDFKGAKLEEFIKYSIDWFKKYIN